MVSGHRFNIIEDYGCTPATYITPLTFVLVDSVPLIIGVVSAGYGCEFPPAFPPPGVLIWTVLLPVLTIRTFMRRRKEFRDLIAANANLTYSCYWRLVALASVDFCFTIPICIWTTVVNATWNEVHPWVSWADTHWEYDRVDQVPRILINKQLGLYMLEINRWAVVLCAFVFFGFFGFADEAKKNYRLWTSAITKRLGCFQRDRGNL